MANNTTYFDRRKEVVKQNITSHQLKSCFGFHIIEGVVLILLLFGWNASL